MIGDPNAAANLNKLEQQAQMEQNASKALLAASASVMIAAFEQEKAELIEEAAFAEELSGQLGGSASADYVYRYSSVEDLFDFDGNLGDVLNI